MKKLFFLFIASLSFSVNVAQTHIWGGIYSNTTWQKANSPYIVDSNLVVFPGVVLTIQPGVTVKVKPGVVIEMRQSTLTLVGNANDIIYFTSDASAPQIGAWKGIYLHGGSLGPLVQHFNMSYSDRGFYREPNALIYEVTDVTNSTFRYNNYVYAEFKNVKSCLFENNGIALGRTKSIENCFFNNNVAGVADAKGLILNCIFKGNQSAIMGSEGITKKCIFLNNQNGISSMSKGLDYPVVDSCTFKKNNIGIRRTHNATITNNIIDSNQIGIVTNGLCRIEKNSICYNFTGINEESDQYIGWQGANTITQNAISSNTVGLEVLGHNDVINCNTICNNATYNLKYNAKNNTILPFARKNAWCSSDSATVASTIYDGYDNIAIGLVNFSPLEVSGCNMGVGVAETQPLNNISFYPNPSTGYFTLNFPGHIAGTLRVFDIHGRVTYFTTFNDVNHHGFYLDAAPGIYVCEVSSGAFVSRQKIVLKD